MTKIRNKISKKNTFYLSSHAFLTAYHFAMQYPEWKEEYDSLILIRGIDYSADRVSGGQSGDSTFNLAVRLSEVEAKMRTVERIVKAVAPDIAKWLLYAVTTDTSYHYLRAVRGLPCGKNYYFTKRRQFYFELAKELNKWEIRKEGHTGDNNLV